MDTIKINNLGWIVKTKLTDGINKTISEFLKIIE
jgi:hypothetical protein